MSDRPDYLLYYISARRELPWETFKTAYDTLQIEQADAVAHDALSYRRGRIARILDALGHCDIVFGEGGGKVYAAPPVLARLPARGVCRAVLCGVRNPQTILDLKAACRALKCAVKVDTQNHGREVVCVPRRVVVEAESSELLAKLAKQVGIGYQDVPPAWGILQVAGSLQQYMAARSWSSEQEINWLRNDFHTQSLQFSNRFTTQDNRLSRYGDPIRSGHIYYLWRGQERARVDVDWGRYALLNADNTYVLLYDARTMRLAVPSTVPLPRLYNRALVVCSGYTPFSIRKPAPSAQKTAPLSLDVFVSVPPDIAQLLATKLGQVLTEATLRMRVQGVNA